MTGIDGKVVAITGASSGIGRARAQTDEAQNRSARRTDGWLARLPGERP